MRIQTLCVCVCVCVCACVCVCDNVEGSLSWHAVVWVAVMCWSVTCSRSHCLLRFLSCQSASMTAVHAKTHRLLSSLLSVCFISLWHILYTHTHARTRAHTHTHTQKTHEKPGQCFILCLISHIILLSSLGSAVCTVTSRDGVELGSLV